MPDPATSPTLAVHLDGETASGPQLVIASAAARQGVSLLERTLELIQDHGLAPTALLVVTLTDSAAHELTTRLRNRLTAQGIKFNTHAMYAGTFLSLCLRLLNEHREQTRMQRSYTVMDPFDQHYFLYQRLANYRALPNSKLVLGENSGRWNQAQSLMKRLNLHTEQALDAKELAAVAHREGRALAACHRLYLQHLKQANALDFSTAQLALLRLLEDNPAVLACLKSQLAYLIIDEQQENSIIKERVLRCLVDMRSAPCLLGDENHARFAKPPASTAVTKPGYVKNVVAFPRTADKGEKTPGRLPANEAVPWWLA